MDFDMDSPLVLQKVQKEREAVAASLTTFEQKETESCKGP